ncbi:hypothetical protein ASG52_11465 [Methylobacterium sp. Leaf456]|uniref:hypothetical protein n=1 Tax=Methylobacterium sp. Leaf456 TaxID=1736382 RepID=UPI0006F3A274|nr:hypothetical protein [Methylobacterium sp. Leaf456]KQT47873.1 hypothetical protein ASG52_11465 [Methylobacterium sp. Leaf456]
MKTFTKITAAVALSLGMAATPSLAQSVYGDSASYNRDGTLNVWGAHIEPTRPGTGLLGGVGSVVGGVTNAAGNIVTGTVGAAGNVVGGVVGGTVRATEDIVTGSVNTRRDVDYSARGGNAEQLDRPVPQYGRVSGGPAY